MCLSEQQEMIRINLEMNEKSKRNNIIKELQKINQFPQRQDSLTSQMYDLYFIANKFGLYDCADYIKINF